jgi:hypothetical protein
MLRVVSMIRNWTFCVRCTILGRNVGRDRVGDLKLFEPKTMRPLIAVRDREER